MFIGITGRAGAGKSTVASRLVHAHGFTEMSFADPLKRGLAAMFSDAGVTPEHFSDPDLKARTIAVLRATPRHLMQTCGTEWARMTVRPDIWVRLLEARITASAAPDIVVSDVRFDDEAHYCRRFGPLWYVWRTGNPRDITHSSESGVDANLIDLGILNDDDLDALYSRIDACVADARGNARGVGRYAGYRALDRLLKVNALRGIIKPTGPTR